MVKRDDAPNAAPCGATAPEARLPGRREVLQGLALAAAAVPLACAAPTASVETAVDAGGFADASDAAKAEVSCSPVGAGATVTLGPLSGGVTDHGMRLAVRTSAAAKVQFELVAKDAAGNPAGKPLRTACAVTDAAEDFAIVLDIQGLPPATAFAVTPWLDEVALSAHAIEAHTFPVAGKPAAFSFCFGSCQKHGDGDKGPTLGKTYEAMADLAEKPMFFAQIGDWTYPDYLFSAKAKAAGNGSVGFGGVDKDGNNYTVFPEELRLSWHRRLDPAYAMRKVLKKVPVAHVWDDHDFAQNNAHRDVAGKQEDRVAAFARYLPTWPLPKSRLGVWQQFTVGHVEFWLVDMRSQRTEVAKTVTKTVQPDGTTKLTFAEPPGHTLLGAEQLAWLLDGLKASTATWKVVFLPVEINPLFDKIMKLGLQLNVQPAIEAAADGWCGYPTERAQLLDLHKSGKVKNLVFLTGDAHQASMKERDADCPPVFMAANLDIGQAPVMDLLEAYGIPGSDIWPFWTQFGDGGGCFGRLTFVTSPAHEVWCDAVDPSGNLLKRMVVKPQ